MRIGTVSRIFRYPVKSMRGEELEETHAGFLGLPGDRRYAFVQAENRGVFPWLTGRQVNELLRYRPEYEAPPGPDPGREPPLAVVTPEGDRFGIFDEELKARLEARLGSPIFLLHTFLGVPDVAPISVFSLGRARAIEAAAGVPVDPRRFRANLYVEPEGAGYEEEDLPGRVLAIGDSLRVTVSEQDSRCTMITLDPDTTAGEPAVLRAVAQQFGNMAGVYGVILQPGTVRVGDPVVLED